jgi:hypothetical protein
VFEHNDCYQSDPATRGTGIGIGFQSSPNGAIVRFNFIHDIGLCKDLDQAVYVSRGNGVRCTPRSRRAATRSTTTS